MNELQYEPMFSRDAAAQVISQLHSECDNDRIALAAAQAQNAALVEAMGKEWEEQWNTKVHYLQCRECKRMHNPFVEEKHAEGCTRGRFFALAPDAGKAWVEAVRLAEEALNMASGYVSSVGTTPECELVGRALAALGAIGGEA